MQNVPPRPNRRRMIWLALGASAWLIHTAPAQDVRAAGRRAAEQYQHAVVTVRITSSVKMSFGAQSAPEQERKMETSGTVIRPDGLTLILLSALDPGATMSRMMSADDGFKMESQVKDIKLILADQREVAATVVLRDPELDVALIRPTEKPASPMPAIELAGAVEPNLLDPVFVLVRLGKVADRGIAAMTGEVQAVVSKPRKFYVPSAELASGGPAVPIFSAEGKLIGFVMLRMMPEGDDDTDSMMGASGGDAMPIIMPAAQIAEIAKQAAD